jgi:hypothetical protein
MLKYLRVVFKVIVTPAGIHLSLLGIGDSYQIIIYVSASRPSHKTKHIPYTYTYLSSEKERYRNEHL